MVEVEIAQAPGLETNQVHAQAAEEVLAPVAVAASAVRECRPVAVTTPLAAVVISGEAPPGLRVTGEVAAWGAEVSTAADEEAEEDVGDK